MFNSRSYSDYLPSKRQLRKYTGYDVDDILGAIGLERRNVWMDVLGYTAIFIGGALVGSVLAAFLAPKEFTEKAKAVAKEYGTDFKRAAEHVESEFRPNV